MNLFITIGIFLFVTIGCGLDKKGSGSFKGNEQSNLSDAQQQEQGSEEASPEQGDPSHVIDPDTESATVPIEVIDIDSGEDSTDGEESNVKNYKVVIWPPDQKWRNFMLKDTLQSAACAVDTMSSNDSEAVEGDDFVKGEDGVFKVMAEKHSEPKETRVYTVKASCENGDIANIVLEVPYSMSGGKGKYYEKKEKKGKKGKKPDTKKGPKGESEGEYEYED